jgi:hypothetical protein
MANVINDSQVVFLLTGNIVANSASEGVNRALYNAHALQFVSAGTGTLLVEASLDGSNWVAIDSSVDPNTIIQIPGHYNWIRCTRDNTTDAVTVILASYDHASV